MKYPYLQYLSYLLIILVSLTACGSEPATPLVESPQLIQSSEDGSTPLLAIQLEVGAIARKITEARLRIDSLRYDCDGKARGGQATYFWEGDQLRLIRHSYYEGEHLSGQVDYYLKDGQLIYASTSESVWSIDTEFVDDSPEPPSREDVTEYRFYYGPEGNSLKSEGKTYIIRTAIDREVNPDLIDTQPVDEQLARLLWENFDNLVRQDVVSEIRASLCV